MSPAKILSLPDLDRSAFATSQEYAYQRMRHCLMVGAIEPGRPVTIRGLAEALGVSPTPAREALRQLSTQNALAVLENRRIMVPRLTRQRFEELVALRTALECHAAVRAIPHLTDFQIDSLRQLDLRMDEILQAGDYAAVVLLNQRFHAGIYSANPEQFVMPMVESVWLQLGPLLRAAARHDKTAQSQAGDHHKEIIEALRRRDPEALTTALKADIRDGVARLGHEALRAVLGELPADVA